MLWTRPDGTPGGAPIRSDWLAVLESSLPSEFFERAPFDRVALWLHVAPADSQPGARAPADRWYLLEGDRTGTEWLDVELELPAAVCRARNPSHREALVAGAVLGGLAEVARRFALPARSLRRARQRQLTRVPLRRRV